LRNCHSRPEICLAIYKYRTCLLVQGAEWLWIFVELEYIVGCNSFYPSRHVYKYMAHERLSITFVLTLGEKVTRHLTIATKRSM
jgi:hypothetical protein